MPNFMEQAFIEAEKAKSLAEVPVGAVIVNGAGEVIARAHNLVESNCDPTAHAEILAIRQASLALSSPRLTDCDLYVTLEPCTMCAGAISHARLRRVIFAAYDPKGGAVDHGARFFHLPTCHHAPDVVGGVEETRASTLLKSFFAERRAE